MISRFTTEVPLTAVEMLMGTGSMDSTPTLEALNIDPNLQEASVNKAIELIGDRVATFDADQLDHIMNDRYRQSGTICYTANEFKETEHGRENANAGLYELTHVPNSTQQPSWWEPSAKAGPNRPLAGLKVIDLTRIIAGPAISKGLAEWGASVMRVTGPKTSDLRALHADLNWGKWNCSIDLKTEAGKEQLRNLIRDADVILDGYRPGVMEHLGFGREDVLRLVEGRDRGIVYARENCYGWHGPWQDRSGWQQISDAVGNDDTSRISSEANTTRYAACLTHMVVQWVMTSPSRPSSRIPATGMLALFYAYFTSGILNRYSTGVSGLCGIVHALIERGTKGGSVFVDVSTIKFSYSPEIDILTVK